MQAVSGANGQHRPRHVPKDRAFDFDFVTMPWVTVDPQLAWKRIQNTHPDIFWTPQYGGHWVVTRGDYIREIYENVADFSSEIMSYPRAERPEPYKMAPLELDPPEHTDYRRVLNPAFAPKSLQALKDRVRALTVELIEGFREKGECEFVNDFAFRMPVSIFMDIVDLPKEDLPDLLRWAQMVIHPGDDLSVAAEGHHQTALYAYCKAAERRAKPGDDLISRVVTTPVNGALLTDKEAAGVITLLLFGGLDTVASVLGFMTRHLAEHPEHNQALIDDPALIPNAVEEYFRRFSVPSTGRMVKHDMEFHGVQLRAGEFLQAPNILYNLDDRLWPQPLTVDFHRTNASQHLTFNIGHHRCIGAPLARLELTIFLEEWTRRIGRFRVKPGTTVLAKGGSVVGLDSLPLVWG